MRGPARALEWERAGTRGGGGILVSEKEQILFRFAKEGVRGEGERNVVARDMCKAH